MTIKFHLIKRNSLFVIFFLNVICFLPFSSVSQNLYNLEQSQKYAEYLFISQQYNLAAEEFERLIYLDNNNIDFKYKLVQSYRLSNNLNVGIRRIYTLYGDSLSIMPQNLATEFVKLQILSDSITTANKFIRFSKTLSIENKNIFRSCNLLLNGEYHQAQLYVKDSVNLKTFSPKMKSLTEDASNTKFKSPFLAASLSAIIPGTGKFYTKNWSDGIFSMLFVAGNAWQAYRGFNKHGTKSGYGWFFGGLSASFYFGNIYGAVKAAKRYNKGKKNEIDNQVFEFVRSDSF